MDKDRLIIKHYYADTKDEYIEFVRSNSFPKEFEYIKIQNFTGSNEKHIFLLLYKGFFNKFNILEYCIIYNYTERDSHDFCKISFNIPDKIINAKHLNIIADFIIHPRYRRKKLGTYLYNEIIERYYKNNSFILYSDGEGKYFWPCLGFELHKKDKVIMIKESTC